VLQNPLCYAPKAGTLIMKTGKGKKEKRKEKKRKEKTIPKI
jgi:hypothetical protein